MAKHDSVYIVVPGAKQGGRIGLVKYNEQGYYQTDFDNAPVALEIVESVVSDFNRKLNIPEEVVEAMHAGSMFGWNVPAAKAAHDYFNETPSTYQRIDTKVETAVDALASAVDRAEAKTGYHLGPVEIDQEKERVFGACGGACGEAPCIAYNEEKRRKAAHRARREEITITEAPTPQLIDVTPQSLRTPEGIRRVTQAQKEWDDATYEIATYVTHSLDELYQTDTPKTTRAEIYSELKTLIKVRNEKQEAFFRAVAGR